jgi:RND family efflux transporter MFP subunit
LLTLSVKAGAAVTAGQALATIDPTAYKQAVDQASSDLQAAQENLTTLKTPATALVVSKADVTVAQAQAALEQSRKDLATLQAPDIASLQAAVANAQDSLAVAKLQQDLAVHDATAKTERDLSYSVDWHQRRAFDLADLVAHGKANLEQTNQVTTGTEQDLAAQAQAQLAITHAKRVSAADAATTKVAAAQEAIVAAQKTLDTARAGGDALALAKARLAVQETQLSLDQAKSDRADLVAGTDAATIAAAQADLDKKSLTLTNAKAALSGATLTAPFSGTVLKTNITPGSLVGSGTVVLSMADLKTVQVVASVDETNIKKLTAGQSATVTFDALPGQTLRGAVGDIPLQGALQGGIMVYQVPIALQGADKLPLLVGMTANVKVSLGQANKVLVVPALAIQRASSGYQVLVPNAADPQGEPAAVAVQIGLSDGTYTQIVSGLSLGDKIVYKLAATTTNNNNQNRGFSIFGFGFGR